MFDSLKSSIISILSSNGINIYNEFSDIDLVKNFNKNIGFISIKSVEKINDYQDRFEVKSREVFVYVECKIIAKKGMTASELSDKINSIYEDFMFSDDTAPISLKIGEMKVNNLYSRFEANMTLKLRCFLTETVSEA